MTLSTTLAIYLGFFIECLWLWNSASEKFDKTKPSQIKAPGYSTPMMVISITIIIGIILIGISEIVGQNPITNFIDDLLQFLLMGIAMFFVLIAGAVAGWMVPRVNEYNIVSVLAIIALNSLTQDTLTNSILIAVFTVVPLLLTFTLVIQRSTPTLISKVVLYLMYLGALIFLSFQSGIMEIFQQTEFTILEAFVFGSMLSFLALHTLFGIRFFVIATSLILPVNRKYIQPMMNKLFKDDQVAPLPFFFAIGGILALIFLNQHLRFFPTNTLTVILVILSVQLLFHTNIKSEII